MTNEEKSRLWFLVDRYRSETDYAGQVIDASPFRDDIEFAHQLEEAEENVNKARKALEDFIESLEEKWLDHFLGKP